MSLLSRYATRAVQRENVRLTQRIATLTNNLRKATRDLEAASERNTQHIRIAIQAAENVLALGNAYDKVWAEYDRAVDALTFVTAERDQALTDKVTLEEENKTLCARNVDLAERAVTAEGQLQRALNTPAPAFDHQPAEAAHPDSTPNSRRTRSGQTPSGRAR